jgi:hypothetical protein
MGSTLTENRTRQVKEASVAAACPSRAISNCAIALPCPAANGISNAHCAARTAEWEPASVSGTEAFGLECLLQVRKQRPEAALARGSRLHHVGDRFRCRRQRRARFATPRQERPRDNFHRRRFQSRCCNLTAGTCCAIGGRACNNSGVRAGPAGAIREHDHLKTRARAIGPDRERHGGALSPGGEAEGGAPASIADRRPRARPSQTAARDMPKAQLPLAEPDID